MIAFRIRTKPFLKTKNVILMHFAQEQVKKIEKVEDKLRIKFETFCHSSCVFLKGKSKNTNFLVSNCVK